MFSKQLLHSSFIRLSLIAVVLCSITLLGARSTGQAKAASPQMEQSIVATSKSMPNATADQVFVKCTVSSVSAHYISNNVILYSTDCSPSTGNIQFFDVHDLNSKQANQALAIGLSARITGIPVTIVYDSTDTTGVVDPQNHRKILALALAQP